MERGRPDHDHASSGRPVADVPYWTLAQYALRCASWPGLTARRPPRGDHRRRARASPSTKGLGDHDRARRGGRDGHVERADPPLLRVDGRRARGGIRAGRAAGPRGVRRGDGARPATRRGAARRSSGPTRRPTRTGRSSCGSTPGRRRPAGRRCRRRRAGSTSSGRGCSRDHRARRRGRGVRRATTPTAPRGGSCRCSTGWRSRWSPTGRPSRARTSSAGPRARRRWSWGWRRGRSGSPDGRWSA